MALLAGAICGERHDSCLPKQKNARALHQMSSQSPSRGVDLLLAQKFRFFKPKNGPTSGSKQARTDVLLTMVLGPLRRGSGWDRSPWSTTVAARPLNRPRTRKLSRRRFIGVFAIQLLHLAKKSFFK